MLKMPICVVMMAVHVCNANIHITGGETLYFAYTDKLSITCTNNVDVTVEFRKSGRVLTSCVQSNGCTVNDERFTVIESNGTSERKYLLETVSLFTTDLCGSYKCFDVQTGRTDTANVFLKDFDNNSYFAEEKENELSISTACAFPADLEITWYTFNNEDLREISAEDLEEYNNSNRSTPCPNVICNMSQAQNFTFGLNFSETSSSLSFFEVKIVHSMFKDKPLVWRSTKQYPIVMSQSAPEIMDWWKIALIVLRIVLFIH